MCYSSEKLITLNILREVVSTLYSFLRWDDAAWYIWVDRILWFRLKFLRHITLLILRRPILLPYLYEGWNFASSISLYLYVPDKGGLLTKYRDCTTSNDFELYLISCVVMLLLLYIYIYFKIPVQLDKVLYALNAQQHSSFWRRCLFNSSCDSEFHIHGVICMIVRHNKNALCSATNSDFYVSY